MSRILALACFFFLAGAVSAQPRAEPLVKKVKTSIAKGVGFLVKQQRPDGGWEASADDKSINDNHGGLTALVVLALLNSDGVLDDPAREAERKKSIERGLANLRKIDSPKVYVRSLQTMALAEAKTDTKLIKRNVDWLLEARVYRDGKFIGWEYANKPGNRTSDASNSQYAMLALWYARQAGVPIERKVWEEIADYYARTQNKDGSWIYSADYGPNDEIGPSMTMTVAGLCGLLISGMELNGGREKWLANGRFENCGSYDENLPVAKAQQWLKRNFTIDLKQRAYYHLYGLERAGRLSGNRFFGEHDWYREGCEFLVKRQDPSGAWPTNAGYDRWPHVNTSFALLFLSKGRTPVLISKLVHGTTFPNRELDNDWNNDRNDLRHLTDFISKSDLFHKKTIAWQTYDIRRAVEALLKNNPAPNAAEEAAIVADMRQAPILYITGHKSLLPGRLSAGEVRLIKRYVESGGFIFAEACCGDPAFDAGFKEWVKDVWDQDLTYIDAVHPVWNCFNNVQPGKPYKLMELKTGCRTVMFYSPQDLSCHWESNQHDGAARPAFWLGANIVAYATGKVPPQPRLTPIEVADNDKEMKEPRQRGALRIRQLRVNDDWQPAPKAMRNLLEHVHTVTGLDVAPRVLALRLSEAAGVRGAKFIYMHGRGDFRADPNNLKPLRFTLEYGGLLFADACCGDKDFDKAFRKFAQDLFPNEKLAKVPADAAGRDYLFSAALNDKEELSAKNIKCRVKANGEMAAMEPHLEGIKINGRWVVLYSPYDIGCALERNTAPDCAGYDPDSALKIATAAVRYNTRP